MSELSDSAAIVTADAPNVSAARDWLGEIARSQRKYSEWHSRGDKVIRRYKDERNDRDTIANTNGRKMNLLWSNVETIKPACYSQTPEPNVSRRNKDADPVGRWASIVIERCVNASLDTQDFDHTMRLVVQDVLLPGRGMAIEEYVPTIEGEPAADLAAEATETADEGDGQRVTQQRSITRYLHWKDCLTNLARVWDEVWWFGYRVFLTREEVAEKFGEEVANAITLDHKQQDDRQRKTGGKDAKATIWTVWCKRSRKVYQVAPGYPDMLLAEMEPPVVFEDFWPIPRPVQATTGPDSIIPVPDFAMYQDQADEVDLLTNRIYKLSESLKLRGLYPADMDSVKRLLQDASDTEMIPIENWAMLGERGGANGLVVWFPLKEVATTLATCIQAREQAKEALYEVTGMGDIIRGASNASETATAQQLKSQWGSLRIRDRQRDIQRFARDLIRKKAAVISEHFTQETLAAMSGVNLLTALQKQQITQYMQAGQQFMQAQQQAAQMGAPPPMVPGILQAMPQPTPDQVKMLAEPTWDDVMALLRNDKLRGFSIDIETDSTIEPDQQAEQQKATEFLVSVTQYLTACLPIVQAAPQAASMLGELLLFGARRFKISETVETSIEKFTATMQAQAQQPPMPNPKIAADAEKAQSDIEVAKIGAQAAGVKAQAETTKAQIGIQQTMAEHETTMLEKRADMAIRQAASNPALAGLI